MKVTTPLNSGSTPVVMCSSSTNGRVDLTTGRFFGWQMEILVGLLCASSQSHEALDLKSRQVDVEIPTDPMQVSPITKCQKMNLPFLRNE
jgi:hypothetical protein